jgi:outer membrane protein assembly factor BamB
MGKKTLLLICFLFTCVSFAGNTAKSTIIWERQFNFSRFQYTINLIDTMLYLSSCSRTVEVISQKNGKTVWNIEFKGDFNENFSVPFIENKTLFFGNIYGNFYSYDIVTHNKNYEYICPIGTKKLYCESPCGGITHDSTLIIAGEYDQGGRIQCLLKKKGNVLWNKFFEDNIISSIITDGISIYALAGRLILCLDYSGNIKWKYEDEYVAGSQIKIQLIDDKIIYCSSKAIHVLSKKDGTIVWINNNVDCGRTTPLIIANSLIVRTDLRTVSIFDIKSGEKQWSCSFPDKFVLDFKPVILCGHVCCGAIDNDTTTLYWLDEKNGLITYQLTLENNDQIVNIENLDGRDALISSIRSKGPNAPTFSVLKRMRFICQ